jgi:hypothetical protein
VVHFDPTERSRASLCGLPTKPPSPGCTTARSEPFPRYCSRFPTLLL